MAIMGATEQDPLAVWTLPPPNETAGERAEREQREAKAQQISDQIDEELRREKAALKKQHGMVRVLLLGQSESGKSTTLKNFRMKYARDAWKAELASWRAVIQLNLIRSITTIVDTLQAEMDNEPLEPPHTAIDGEGEYLYDPLSNYGATPTVASASFSRRPSVSKAAPGTHHHTTSTSQIRPQANAISSPLTGKHQLLKLRLGPLRRVETDLRKRLGAGADDEIVDVASLQGYGALGNTAAHTIQRKPTREFGVRRLKDALANGSHLRGESPSHGSEDGDAPDEATEVVASCREDMKALWTDEAVRVVLKKRKMRLEDSAGFFLDDLDRIATRDYVPSDDDVVRARLRTLGVQEYKIQLDSPAPTMFTGALGDFGREWILYDVGGSRTTRHAWLPYFDNVNAIIFLAPVSCFDERLQEDSRVNRLEDSFLLWRSVCSSKLLAKTTLILFINKCDLLKRKLRSGIKVKNYLPSYGDRSNEAGAVVKYLKEKFKDIAKVQSPEPRLTYYYATSVTDTKTTATTLKAVKDSILREHLKSADFV